jgi:predicted translin family RNA/ssDNA-binding protein
MWQLEQLLTTATDRREQILFLLREIERETGEIAWLMERLRIGMGKGGR